MFDEIFLKNPRRFQPGIFFIKFVDDPAQLIYYCYLLKNDNNSMEKLKFPKALQSNKYTQIQQVGCIFISGLVYNCLLECIAKR